LPTYISEESTVPDQWMHYAVTSDGTDWTFYENGQEVMTTQGNDSDPGSWLNNQCDNTQLNFIGRWWRSLNDEFFKGIIDEVTVWDFPLSSTEVEAI
ncbi:MAG: LamG domain-containing protein, partial [Flavobacteriales bacterium]|nr:LamG domain-containing protein [Flavobacteriales bacterium]